MQPFRSRRTTAALPEPLPAARIAAIPVMLPARLAGVPAPQKAL